MSAPVGNEKISAPNDTQFRQIVDEAIDSALAAIERTPTARTHNGEPLCNLKATSLSPRSSAQELSPSNEETSKDQPSNDAEAALQEAIRQMKHIPEGEMSSSKLFALIMALMVNMIETTFNDAVSRREALTLQLKQIQSGVEAGVETGSAIRMATIISAACMIAAATVPLFTQMSPEGMSRLAGGFSERLGEMSPIELSKTLTKGLEATAHTQKGISDMQTQFGGAKIREHETHAQVQGTNRQFSNDHKGKEEQMIDMLFRFFEAFQNQQYQTHQALAAR